MNKMRNPQLKSALFMRWLCIPIFAILISFVSQAVGATDLPTYTKQTELGPIVLSYSDVDQLVTSLEGQIAIANRKDRSDQSSRMSLSVEAGEDKVSVNSWRSLSDANRLPEPGKILSLNYSSYDMPIERVEISLNDYQRKIVVEGTERGQVDAIYAYIKDALSRRISPWRGPLLRSIGGIIVFNIGLQLLLLPITMRAIFRRFYSPAKIVFIQVLGGLITLSVFALPWESLLPGFAVYLSTDNTDRMIGLAGLAIGVLTLMGWLRPKPISADQSPHENVNANGNSG
jgi:hypothetical protein